MITRRSVGAAAAALVLVLALSGCGSGSSGSSRLPPDSSGSKQLTVFAAASLTGTFTRLGKTFEAEHPGTTVRFNFGSSATLAEQITQGAPVDVFASASPAPMKTVTGASLANTPTTFTRNKLEIAVPPDNPANVRELRELSSPNLKVALCAEQVPCGAAAVKALDAAHVKVTPVTLEQDVKAAVTKVQLREVDAALVYRTDVLAAAGKVKGIPFPAAGKAINDYPIATLKDAPTGPLAKQFMDLVLSKQGQDVLAKAGFEAP